MKIDALRKRLEAIETALGRETIILGDGSKWSPRISLLNMFVGLMEFECGGSPEDLPPEFGNEAAMWAKYERRPGEPPFYNMMGEMARNLVKNGPLERNKND